MSLTIAIGQIEVKTGHPRANVEAMRRLVKQAKQDGADIIAFPEQCVGGYFAADKWCDEVYVADLERFNDEIRDMSEDIGIIWGNVSTDAPVVCGRDGRTVRLNAAFFAYQKEYVAHHPLSGRHIKVLQPDYRIFDDTRYFLSAIELAQHMDCTVEDLISPFVFEHSGQVYRIGIQICEDLWSKDYAVDPTAILIRKGADVIINISASPWTLTKEVSRDKRVKEHVKTHGEIPPLYYVNVAGMQNVGKNVLMFDGMSTVYDRQGNRVCILRDDFKADYACVDPRQSFSRTCEHKLMTGLVRSIQEFDQQVLGYGPKWLIGLSGGLDSSINAALLVMALGNKRVIGYNLATRYNSEHTKANAANEAEALGIELRNGDISAVYESTVETAYRYGYEKSALSELVHENIQARVRGHLLSTFAQIENGVVMNNGNKIEIAVGYATLYGDTIGALSPLGDLTKVQLFDLAREINAHFGKEVVPERLLPTLTPDGMIWDMAPSAELKNQQVDPMKWYYHDWLISKLMEYPSYHVEDIMEAYADGSLLASDIGKWLRYYHLDEPEAFISDLEWVLRQMRTAVFKRLQMPPIVMVTRGAFGMDHRETQGRFDGTERYQQLKELILQQQKDAE